MSRRAVVVSLAVAGSVLTLGGCAGAPQSGSGSNVGGSAARSDLLDIGQEELIAEVQAFQEDAGLPENQPAPGLARATLERMIQDQLIQARATQTRGVDQPGAGRAGPGHAGIAERWARGPGQCRAGQRHPGQLDRRCGALEPAGQRDR